MKLSVIITTISVGLTLCWAACTKDRQPQPGGGPDTQQPPPAPVERTDLSIHFSRYERGQVYTSDTIFNEFVITNRGSETLKAGTLISAACRINGRIFDLELIGSGPTKLELTQDLDPDGTFLYNPGYLLGSSMMAYFQADSVEVGIMVFGVNGAGVDMHFPEDARPDDNSAFLLFDKEGLKLLP